MFDKLENIIEHWGSYNFQLYERQFQVNADISLKRKIKLVHVFRLIQDLLAEIFERTG